MITRRDLRRIPQLNKLIERKKEHLLFLDEKATSIPSTMPDHERVQTSPSGSGNRYIEAAIDLSKEIAEIEKELDVVKRSIREQERLSRSAANMEEKLAVTRKIEELERQKRKKRNELADREDEVSAQRRRMIEELDRRMVKTTNSDDIFVISWQTV